MTTLTSDEYKDANATLELYERLQLVRLTPMTVELDRRFEEHLEYFEKHESLSVQDLNMANMWRILTSYFKKNHQAEREMIKWMDTLDNDFIIELEFNAMTKFMSDILEDLELDHDTIPEAVGLTNEATFHCRVQSCYNEMYENGTNKYRS